MRLAGEPDVEVIAEAGNVAAALELLRSQPVDLVFLDVQMPGASGFELVRGLGPDAPAVVFVTAYADYAVDAFRVRALDYLLKPVDDERFALMLERVRDHLRRDGDGAPGRGARPTADGGATAAPRAADRIAVKSNGQIRFVEAAEIDWLEADGDYVRLHAGKDTHLVRGSLTDLHEELDPALFVRIHRSTVVRLDRIREMQPLFHGEYSVALKDGTRLKLSRGYRAAVERVLGRL